MKELMIENFMIVDISLCQSNKCNMTAVHYWWWEEFWWFCVCWKCRTWSYMCG